MVDENGLGFIEAVGCDTDYAYRGKLYKFNGNYVSPALYENTKGGRVYRDVMRGDETEVDRYYYENEYTCYTVNVYVGEEYGLDVECDKYYSGILDTIRIKVLRIITHRFGIELRNEDGLPCADVICKKMEGLLMGEVVRVKADDLYVLSED
jgi:hypothetical protein